MTVTQPMVTSETWQSIDNYNAYYATLPINVSPDVTPRSPYEKQPAIGLVGMGLMGRMYARYLSEAGWQK